MSEATTVEKKEIKPISDLVQDWSKKINDQLSFDKQGVPSLKDEAIYLALAKESDLDEATIKKVRTLDDNFTAAACHALGTAAIPIYVENADVKEVSLTFKMTGRDRMIVESMRHQTFPNQKDRDQPHQVYGAVRAIHEMSLNNKNAGQYGIVVQTVKSAAAAALKDL